MCRYVFIPIWSRKQLRSKTEILLNEFLNRYFEGQDHIVIDLIHSFYYPASQIDLGAFLGKNCIWLQV